MTEEFYPRFTLMVHENLYIKLCFEHVGITGFVSWHLCRSNAVFMFSFMQMPMNLLGFLSLVFVTCVSDNARWMNGQYLRSLPPEELTKLVGERWKSTGMVTGSGGSFIEVSISLLSYFMLLWNYKIINHRVSYGLTSY